MSKKPEPEDDQSLTPPLESASANGDRPTYVPGAIFRATLDPSHWLTMGYERQFLPVMLQGSTMLSRSKEGDSLLAGAGAAGDERDALRDGEIGGGGRSE